MDNYLNLMSEEEAIQFIKDNPNMGRPTIMRNIGWKEGPTYKLMQAIRKGNIQKISLKKPVPHTKFRRAMSAEDFIHQFDIPAKIREALEELGDRVISDSDFRTDLGIQSTLWRRGADRDEFNKYQVQIRGKIYWALPEVIERIRETMDVM